MSGYDPNNDPLMKPWDKDNPNQDCYQFALFLGSQFHKIATQKEIPNNFMPSDLMMNAWTTREKCLKGYRPELGVRFSTYWTKAFIRNMMRENDIIGDVSTNPNPYSKLAQQRHPGINRLFVLNTELDIPERTENKLHWREDLLEFFKGQTSEKESVLEYLLSLIHRDKSRDILRLKLLGHKNVEIARIKRMSRERIRQVVQSTLSELRDTLLSQEEGVKPLLKLYDKVSGIRKVHFSIPDS